MSKEIRPIDANALEKKAKQYSLGYWEEDEWAVPLCEIDEAPTLDMTAREEYAYECGYEHFYHECQNCERRKADTYGTWISCEERLPKTGSGYYRLITIYFPMAKTYRVGYGHHIAKNEWEYHTLEGIRLTRKGIAEVVAWCELPKPYVPVMEYPQVDGITPSVVSKTDTENAKYSCEGCRYDGMNYLPYRCDICTRGVKCDDMYERSK